MSSEAPRVSVGDVPADKKSDAPDYLNFLRLTNWDELRALVSGVDGK